MQEGWLGEGQELFLTTCMDAWDPAVRGNYARAFEGFMKVNGFLKRGAIKIMRHDNKDHALPLFRMETQILDVLKGVKGFKNIEKVVPMWECGFIKSDDIKATSSDKLPPSLRNLKGTVRRFFLDETPSFLNQLDEYANEGWLPYLVIEPLFWQQNLLLLCDTSYVSQRQKFFQTNKALFFPIDKALDALVQACLILEVAHSRNVVYMDHKIVHYYWDDEWQILRLMDWNGGQLHPKGLSDDIRREDLRQFTARMAFHLLTGRSLPGALEYYSTPELIAAEVAKTYKVEWHHDDIADERIPEKLRNAIEQALQGEFKSARVLGERFQDLLDEL